MAITKTLISAPLEAGQSLLDVKQLPAELTVAFEYVSERLARKRLHLSLIVVRKDIQLPDSPSTTSSQINPPIPSPKRAPSPTISTTSSTSPSRSLFNAGISSFHRSPSKSSTHSSSTTSTLSDTSSIASTPNTSPVPVPSSPITLLHAHTLAPKALRILHQTLSKASKKHPILSTIPPPTSSPTTQPLITRSLTQNEILFQSTGLELLSLDHIYILKHHLHTYSTTLSPSDLSLAIDELHRCLLSRNGRKIQKSHLLHEYSWLGISMSALLEVNEGYKLTYGGYLRSGGIDLGVEERIRNSPPPALEINTAMEWQQRRVRLTYDHDEGYESRGTSTSDLDKEVSSDEEVEEKDEGYESRSRTTSISSESCLSFYAMSPSYSPTIPIKQTHTEPGSPIRAMSPLDKPLPSPPPAIIPLPSPAKLTTPSSPITTTSPTTSTSSPTPTLSLVKPIPTSLPQTTTALKSPKPSLKSPKLDTSFLHALPLNPNKNPASPIHLSEDRGPHFRGPMTPNGYEDITPVTKGEWCFLMVGESTAWGSGRRVPVVTC